MQNRIAQIVRCMDELASARHDQKAGNMGALLGEMDWLDELHALIHNA